MQVGSGVRCIAADVGVFSKRLRRSALADHRSDRDAEPIGDGRMRVDRELLRGDHREDFQGDGVHAESHPRRRLLHAEQVVVSRAPVNWSSRVNRPVNRLPLAVSTSSGTPCSANTAAYAAQSARTEAAASGARDTWRPSFDPIQTTGFAFARHPGSMRAFRARNRAVADSRTPKTDAPTFCPCIYLRPPGTLFAMRTSSGRATRVCTPKTAPHSPSVNRQRSKAAGGQARSPNPAVSRAGGGDEKYTEKGRQRPNAGRSGWLRSTGRQ
jgi:hypothetical protein